MSSTVGDREALMGEISPKLTLTVRLIGIGTLLMVILAFIFCIVRAETQPNKFLYLLACNMLLSCFIGGINAWWYKQGHLTSDKYWYVLIVATVIIWQCIATDVYAFHSSSRYVPHNGTTTSVAPTDTSAATITTTTAALMTTT